jgi:hypothetical protein
MGQSILFAVLLSASVLLGMLPATTPRSGWKALLLPLLWIGATLVIWSVMAAGSPAPRWEPASRLEAGLQ